MATAEQILKFKGTGPVLSHWPRQIDIPHDTLKEYSPKPDQRDYRIGIDVKEFAGEGCKGVFYNFSNAWTDEAKEMLGKVVLDYDENRDRLECKLHIPIAGDWTLTKVIVRLGKTHNVRGIKKWLKDELYWSHPVKGYYMTFYDWPDED